MCRMAHHTWRMHHVGRERMNLPGNLDNEGTHGNEDHRNIERYDAAPMKGTATSGPMHCGLAQGPVDMASLHVAASAGLGPTLVPWTRMAIAMTPFTLVVVVPVAEIREVPGAPPHPPTHFVHLLHRGASHLIHLALFAHVPVEAAMLARIGVISAAIMDQGRAVRRTATGSSPGKGHQRGSICHTSSMAMAHHLDG